MKRTRFPDVETVKNGCEEGSLSDPDRSFQECMEAWQRRMAKCVRSQGVTLKMACYNLQIVFGIKDLCTQSPYFSNTPCIFETLFATARSFFNMQRFKLWASTQL